MERQRGEVQRRPTPKPERPAPRAAPPFGGSIAALQPLVGNAAVTQAATSGLLPNLGSNRPIARRAVADDPSDKPKRTKGPNEFLAQRISRFAVRPMAGEYVVLLDRSKNPWSESYLQDALVLAAFARVMSMMYQGTPSALELMNIGRSNVKSGLAEMSAGVDNPAKVSPMLHTTVTPAVVEGTGRQLGLEVSTRGKRLGKQIKAGSFLQSVFAALTQFSGQIAPLVGDDKLKQIGLSRRALRMLLVDPEHLRNLGMYAEVHSAGAKLKAIAEAHAAGTDKRSAAEVAASIEPAKWASMMSELLGQYAKNRKTLAKELNARWRTYQLNEALRPHRLSVAAGTELVFMRDHYDPDSSVEVNLVGPVKVRGGQRFTNAKNEPLFVVQAKNGTVIFQNEADGVFYRQSSAGVAQELMYGAFAMAGRSAMVVLEINDWMFRFLGVVFPPVGVVYLSSKIVATGQNIAGQLDEITDLYERLKISAGVLDRAMPGFIVAALAGSARSAGSMLGDPKTYGPNAKEWFLTVVKIVMKVARGRAAAQFAIEGAVGLWKKTLSALKEFLWWTYTLGSTAMKSVEKPKDSPAVDPMSGAVQRLIDAGVKDAHKYAAMALRLNVAEREHLALEVEEFSSILDEFKSVATKVMP